MRKKEHEPLTQDETKILILLEQDAKKSIDELAKSCGFSRQKVWRIIKKLEDQKAIWGYTAVTDGTAQNLKYFLVLAKRNNQPFDQDVKKEILFEKIDDYPPGLVMMENIFFTHGVSDWVLTFYAPDIITAKRYVEHTFARFNKYLQEYTILETLVTVRKKKLKNPELKDLLEYI